MWKVDVYDIFAFGLNLGPYLVIILILLVILIVSLLL